MLFQARRFNIILSLLLLSILAQGCRSTESKRNKAPAMLRVHMETTRHIDGRTTPITVFPQAPMTLEIEAKPFLTEQLVQDARVIDSLGGFAMQIQFDHTGRLLLEQYTSMNRELRIAIFSRFPDISTTKYAETNRWLGVPRISQAITNGMILFTPDATRAEADQIAKSLRNAAKKLGNTRSAP